VVSSASLLHALTCCSGFSVAVYSNPTAVLDDLWLFNLASKNWTRVATSGTSPQGLPYASITFCNTTSDQVRGSTNRG
jgi:hypothetical protein